MGMVNTRSRRKAASKKGSGVKGICCICGKRTMNALVIKGKPYIDGNGNKAVAADSIYHRECRSMQTRGLLFAGHDSTPIDSSGKTCRGCNTTIEVGDAHAHRSGNPYHRECLI
jgi:hypothetical protein